MPNIRRWRGRRPRRLPVPIATDPSPFSLDRHRHHLLASATRSSVNRSGSLSWTWRAESCKEQMLVPLASSGNENRTSPAEVGRCLQCSAGRMALVIVGPLASALREIWRCKQRARTCAGEKLKEEGPCTRFASCRSYGPCSRFCSRPVRWPAAPRRPARKAWHHSVAKPRKPGWRTDALPGESERRWRFPYRR
jgi:hypothetical protein